MTSTPWDVTADGLLPEGWEVRTKMYPSRDNRAVKVWVSPDGIQFRSWVKVQQHLRGQVDAVCETCGGADDEVHNEILLCDGRRCNKAFHQHCLPCTLTEVPAGDWLCPACESQPKSKKRRHGSSVDLSLAHGDPFATSVPAAPIKPAAHYFELHDTPGCVVWGCGGAGQLASGGDAQYMLACDTCGTRWQSTWWWEQLSGQTKEESEADAAESAA